MKARKLYDAVPDATLACSIILAYLLNIFLPIAKIVTFPFTLIGVAMIVVAFGLAVTIIATLRAKHLSSDATGVPQAFLTTGFYAVSRNPFYLLYVVVALGTAIALGSLTAFVAPILCFIVLNFSIIPLEERILRQKFGSEYERYTRRVRRWL